MPAPIKKRFALLALLLLAAVAVGLLQGAVPISWSGLLLPKNQPILHMRLLRVLTAILVGSGLAVAGIALQAILRNPLAEPYLLGTSSGAGLAAVIAMVLGISRMYLPLAAFFGAIASIILFYNLAREGNRILDRSLILSGVIVSIALSSVIVFLVSLFPKQAVHEITWWLWGGLQVYNGTLVFLVAVPILLGIGTIYVFAQDLNAISLGEEEAMHLGIETQNVKKILILIAALITACLICLCGIVGFVGLIVPHMMRLAVGPNHKVLIPTTCLAASVFVVVCDVLSRTLFAPIEIPIGVITAIIGAPVFILLLKRGRRF